MNYIDQIWGSICYYEGRHGQLPDVMFVSTPLFCKLSYDMHIEYCKDEPFHRCCGIPVKTYTSLYEEYYLAEGEYWIEQRD
jgi:hypothetical protein